jgi:hypothetical protein
MQRAVCVVEAYVPGLGGRSADWYDRVQESMAVPLAEAGLEAALLAMPIDETLLWLVWRRPERPDARLTVAVSIVRGTLEPDLRSSPQKPAVVERSVDALLVATGSPPGRA